MADDFTGDNYADIVACYGTSLYLASFNPNSGNFSAFVSIISSGTTDGPFQLAAADVDMDGAIDLTYLTYNPTTTVTAGNWLKNIGTPLLLLCTPIFLPNYCFFGGGF